MQADGGTQSRESGRGHWGADAAGRKASRLQMETSAQSGAEEDQGSGRQDRLQWKEGQWAGAATRREPLSLWHGDFGPQGNRFFGVAKVKLRLERLRGETGDNGNSCFSPLLAQWWREGRVASIFT